MICMKYQVLLSRPGPGQTLSLHYLLRLQPPASRFPSPRRHQPSPPDPKNGPSSTGHSVLARLPLIHSIPPFFPPFLEFPPLSPPGKKRARHRLRSDFPNSALPHLSPLCFGLRFGGFLLFSGTFGRASSVSRAICPRVFFFSHFAQHSAWSTKLFYPVSKYNPRNQPTPPHPAT